MVLGHLLNSGLSVLQALVLPGVLLAFTVSAVLLAAGWQRRRDILTRQGQRNPANRFELGQTPFASGVLDLATEARAVLQRFEALAAQHFVDLELAVQPGLKVRADPRVLREILSDLTTHAIEQSSCGRVLLGAVQSGGRVQISVSDAGSGADRATQASRLRPAERLAALQGATMEVDARANQGTTVILRLPTSGSVRRSANGALTDPASVWASSRAKRETSGAEQ
jgi:hypothetical protein